MERKHQQIFAALFLGFVALFLVRFILGFFVTFGASVAPAQAARRLIDDEGWVSYRRDVSTNLKQMSMTPQQVMSGGPIGGLVVFAQEAKLASVTNEYQTDEEKVFDIVRQDSSTVRIESREGLAPHRSLKLVVKSPDDAFGALVRDLKTVGRLDAVSVSKEDKTEEVRTLFAKKQSLEDYKASLVKLRGRAGKVEEFIELEGKVQEIEKEIQDLRVQLGDLVKEESYSNVSFSLRETLDLLGTKKDASLADRILSAFLWTCLWYIALLLIVGMLAAVYASVRVLGRDQPRSGRPGKL